MTDQFPTHVVCQWPGNGEGVAWEHYLSVTPEYFEWATSGTALPLDAVSGRTASQAENEPSPQFVTAHKETVARENVRPLIMVEGGLESNSPSADGVTVSNEVVADSVSRAAASAATSVQLGWLTEIWPSLPNESQREILAIAREATRSKAVKEPALK